MFTARGNAAVLVTVNVCECDWRHIDKAVWEQTLDNVSIRYEIPDIVRRRIGKITYNVIVDFILVRDASKRVVEIERRLALSSNLASLSAAPPW